MNIDNSRKISAIVGPVLIVMVTAELRLWNPTLYIEQITPLVYLSGILIFTAGLAIVRSHNVWVLQWPVLLTFVGWAGILMGLTRIFFPQSYKAQFRNDNLVLVVEMILILTGIILTVQAYRRPSR
ncbi:hypothetical protein [Leptospira stimsonii]|uniref:Uncharacterized protein n=1 Tax=Leptospira stimsonii TaxID=2202203 RepID=A0A8B3CSS0_9LEPT|nr:hypothetical protein [Leptospira stimsonii]RHX86243.1 hypothetical protein DLM78_10350 [Leptospira stimsonii]